MGNDTAVKVVKNKLAPPFRTAPFEIRYGQGIALDGEILDEAIEAGVISKSGAWYSYRGEHIAQGRENTRHYIRNDAEFRERLLEELGIGQVNTLTAVA